MEQDSFKTLGMFSDLPRELQIETWLRLTWEDRETICLSDDPPSICFDDDVWNKLLETEERITDESLDSIVRIWTPIINNIFQETSILGFDKYYLLQYPDPYVFSDDLLVIRARDPNEALCKASIDPHFTGDNTPLYNCAITHYMNGTARKGEKFSFKIVAEIILDFMLDNRFGYKLIEVRLID